MSSSSFLTISKAECQKVYIDILQNSDKKWETSKQLANMHEFGSATSMAIISIEELVKALLVYFDGRGFEFRRVKGMKTFFEHHKIRYVIAFMMFVMGFVGDELVKAIRNSRAKPEDITNFMDRLKNDKSFNTTATMFVYRRLIQLKREFDWFSHLDVYRQDGFYCDYEDQLKNPITISKENYVKVIERLDKVRIVGQAIIDTYTEGSIASEHVEGMRKQFKQLKIYSKIKAGLDLLKNTRDNPFEIIKRNFSKTLSNEKIHLK